MTVRFISAFLIVLASFSEPASSQESILGQLESREIRNYMDDRYTGFIEAYEPVQIDQPICVNPVDRQDCLRVFVLDTRIAAGEEYADFFQRLRMNAIAIPNNTIAIDSFLLDLLFAHAFRNRILKVVGAAQGYWPESIAALNWQQQLAMYDFEFGEDAHVKDGWLDAKGLVGDLVGDFEEFAEDDLWFTATLVGPLLEHEIYHLEIDNNYAQAFSRRLRLLIGTYDQIQEERDADLTGYQASERDVIGRIISSTPDSARDRWKTVYAPLYEDYSQDEILSSLAVENISYLPDLFLTLALHDMFNGFRGLRTHELLLKNYYTPCTAERASGITHYGSPDEIFLSEYTPVPALTSIEFARLSAAFNAERQSGASRATHDHNLVRGISLNSLLVEGDKVDYFDFRNFEALTNVMQALIVGRESDIDSELFRDAEPIILSDPTALFSALDAISVGEPEACLGSGCRVYRLPDGGFFETIVEGDRLFRLQGYMNLRGTDTESYLIRMAALDHLLSAFGLNEEDRLYASASIRQSTFECRFGSGYFEGPDFDILSTSVNDQGVVYVRALSKSNQ